MSIGASAFVSPDIFYVNTQNAFIFWTFLGYLMHVSYKKRQEQKAIKGKRLIETDASENITAQLN